MCPLRVILIFLSATVAGFFLLRGLNADPADQFDADADADADGEGSPQGTRAPSFQGWISSENWILDYGGHGKWEVPLVHPCCTTAKF
ncbi:unnamed protein product [Miscanthus lutarioriparius]|uniref:Uncharacterized protein n=1 Tax=Miscanthus lutarioriparius TaxID=422564 RepID=A0A811QJZ4_9POAL|nr:unnamed protein product [Miscanthus lutarioriparius]